MRVGLVRNAAFGMVALVGLGLAGCDDNPTDFDTGETVAISVNPTTMHVAAGNTALLESRTENAGNEPTWEDVEAEVDASCGSGAITVAVPDDLIPELQPPGVFEVTGGNTLGTTCIQLSGGGETATVDVSVVPDSLSITGAPEALALFSTVQLGTELLSQDGSGVSPFDPLADVSWSTDDDDGTIMTVDDEGNVTAEGDLGSVAITATWSDLGATVSSTVTIPTNQPSLEIENAPEAPMSITDVVDLDVNLVNPTDPPADFGPFDQNTDVTWSFTTEDDPDPVSIDAATGEVTAEAVGLATVTVTWNESDGVTASVDVTVE